VILDVRALADRPLQFLHLQYQAGRALWSLSGGQSLSADVATIPTSNASVVPVGAPCFQHAGANLETRPMTENAPLKIVKPSFLQKFKSKRPPNIAGVGTLLTPLKLMRIAEVGDFVRLHADEDNYWTCELCFVSVPIKGVKRPMLHLIDEEIAMQHLSSKKIKRQRLALASKPHDVFFFCIVPSQNLDNSWNATALTACEQAKTMWIEATSRGDEGADEYKVDFAQSQKAFPPPEWPSRTLEELIEVTFRNANIDTDNHPALLRLIGAKPDLD
jgi:hypothetical protein